MRASTNTTEKNPASMRLLVFNDLIEIVVCESDLVDDICRTARSIVVAGHFILKATIVVSGANSLYEGHVRSPGHALGEEVLEPRKARNTRNHELRTVDFREPLDTEERKGKIL